MHFHNDVEIMCDIKIDKIGCIKSIYMGLNNIFLSIFDSGISVSTLIENRSVARRVCLCDPSRRSRSRNMLNSNLIKNCITSFNKSSVLVKLVSDVKIVSPQCLATIYKNNAYKVCFFGTRTERNSWRHSLLEQVIFICHIFIRTK